MNGIKQNVSNLIIVVMVTVTLSGSADAAEIRLLDRVTVEPGIVQLGDVAELYGAPVRGPREVDHCVHRPTAVPAGGKPEVPEADGVANLISVRGYVGSGVRSGRESTATCPDRSTRVRQRQQRRSNSIQSTNCNSKVPSRQVPIGRELRAFAGS